MRTRKRISAAVLTSALAFSIIGNTVVTAVQSSNYEVNAEVEINPFTDVTESDSFYDAVLSMYSQGIMQGINDTTFAPLEAATRAQVTQALYNMDGQPKAVPGGVTSDIPADAWYADAASWAMGRGIVSITGDRFGGEDEISLQELIEMLYSYAKYQKWDVSIGENTNILSYKDFDQIDEKAIAAFQWACGAGIIKDDGFGSLHPQSKFIRAELAAILQRVLDIYKTETAPTDTNTVTEKTQSYKVQPGDTLYWLAKRYNTTIADIVKANPIITNPDFILIGWELKIPLN